MPIARQTQRRLLITLALAAAVVWQQPAAGQASRWALRSEAMGKRGMVSSAHPLASLAGLKMLARGGNAIDAIVATAAALNVVEPEMSGIGGVGFMLLYSAKEERMRALAFGGRAPAAARLEDYTDELKQTGPMAPLVPGNLAGWTKALKDYGTLPLAEVLAPAIDYARNGVILTEFQASNLARAAERLQKFPTSARVYLKADGSPYQAGDLFRNEPLARSLERIAKEGPETFYGGALGQEIAAAFEADGGLITAEDLAGYHEAIDWTDPISTTYRGDTVYAVPPPNSGLQILQTLKVMEGFDLQALGHNTAPYLLHLMETIRLNRLDTDRYIADPRHTTVPVEMLLSDEHIARRRAEVRERVAAAPPSMMGASRRLPVLSDEDLINMSTTHLTAVDGQGNAVNITQTIGSVFGSAYVPGETGIVFTNAAHWFNLDPEHPNALAPGKDVEWCIAPIQVHREGRPYFVGGSPGSYGILQTVPQVLFNLLDFGMNIQEAIGAPRFRWNDDVGATLPAESLRIETRVPEDVIEAIRGRGYEVELLGDWSIGVGGVHAIVVDRERGWLRGGADPRRSGHALGW